MSKIFPVVSGNPGLQRFRTVIYNSHLSDPSGESPAIPGEASIPQIPDGGGAADSSSDKPSQINLGNQVYANDCFALYEVTEGEYIITTNKSIVDSGYTRAEQNFRTELETNVPVCKGKDLSEISVLDKNRQTPEIIQAEKKPLTDKKLDELELLRKALEEEAQQQAELRAKLLLEEAKKAKEEKPKLFKEFPDELKERIKKGEQVVLEGDYSYLCDGKFLPTGTTIQGDGTAYVLEPHKIPYWLIIVRIPREDFNRYCILVDSNQYDETIHTTSADLHNKLSPATGLDYRGITTGHIDNMHNVIRVAEALPKLEPVTTLTTLISNAEVTVNSHSIAYSLHSINHGDLIITISPDDIDHLIRSPLHELIAQDIINQRNSNPDLAKLLPSEDKNFYVSLPIKFPTALNTLTSELVTKPPEEVREIDYTPKTKKADTGPPQKTYKEIGNPLFLQYFKDMVKVNSALGLLVPAIKELRYCVYCAQPQLITERKITLRDLSVEDPHTKEFKINDNLIPNISYYRKFFEASLIVANVAVQRYIINYNGTPWGKLQRAHYSPNTELGPLTNQMHFEVIHDRFVETFDKILVHIFQMNELYGYTPAKPRFINDVLVYHRGNFLRTPSNEPKETVFDKENYFLNNAYYLFRTGLELNLGNLDIPELFPESKIDRVLFEANGFVKIKRKI